MNIPIIAITGTSGKTTTKEMLFSILSTKYKTFKSFQNGNDVWFTSQYVNQIDPTYESIVLEYGMTKKGDIKKHCKLIKPNFGIITNIGEAHIGSFPNGIEGIAAVKSELLEHMDENGTFFLNMDDPYSNLIPINRFKGNIITIGFTAISDYVASDIRPDKHGTWFSVILDEQVVPFFIHAYGKHNVANALFAIAVSYKLGFSIEQIQLGLRIYEKPYGRFAVNYLKNGIVIIDDTFNTKPSSMKAALDTLSEMPQSTKIAVLGCMNDLGSHSTELHKEIGKYFSKTTINYLYTIGVEAKIIQLEAINAGVSPNRTLHFDSKEQLLEYFLNIEPMHTAILFNGYSKINKIISISDIVSSLKQHYKD